MHTPPRSSPSSHPSTHARSPSHTRSHTLVSTLLSVQVPGAHTYTDLFSLKSWAHTPVRKLKTREPPEHQEAAPVPEAPLQEAAPAGPAVEMPSRYREAAFVPARRGQGWCREAVRRTRPWGGSPVGPQAQTGHTGPRSFHQGHRPAGEAGTGGDGWGPGPGKASGRAGAAPGKGPAAVPGKGLGGWAMGTSCLNHFHGHRLPPSPRPASVPRMETGSG